MKETIINHTIFDLCTGASMEIKTKLAQLFIEQAENKIADLTIALKSLDISNIERLAHSLKSSVALFGAQKISDLAEEVEDKACGGDISTISEDHITHLNSLIQLLVLELKDFLLKSEVKT